MQAYEPTQPIEQEPAAIEAFESIIHTSRIMSKKLIVLAEQAAKLHPGVIDPQQRQFVREVIAMCEESSKQLEEHIFLSQWGMDNYHGEDFPDSGIPIDNAEAIVLGLCLAEQGATADAAFVLRPEFFSIFQNQVIFGHVVAMHEAGQDPELHTLAEHLKANGQLESVGGLEHLTSLVESILPDTDRRDAIQSVYHVHHYE